MVNTCLKAQVERILEPIVIPTEKEYKNGVSFYPIMALFNTFKVGYEKKIYKNISTKIIGSLNFTDSSSYYEAKDIFEYYLEIQPRIYLGMPDTAMHGFYAGPFYYYKNFTGTHIEYRKPSKVFTPINPATANVVGIMLGYQFISKGQFTFDVMMGHGMMFPGGDYKRLANRTFFNSYKKGAILHLNINIGIAFN